LRRGRGTQRRSRYGAADFAERTAALAAKSKPRSESAVSCVGFGLDRCAGAKKNCNDLRSASWVPLRVAATTPESPVLPAVCAGASPEPFRYVRVMGMKKDTAQASVFTRSQSFAPASSSAKRHTLRHGSVVGSLVPGSFGSIDQRILGRSIAAEIALHSESLVELSAKMQR